MKSEDGKENIKKWSTVSLAWDLGWLIAAPIVLFSFLGRFLDKMFGTAPCILLFGVFLAVISSVWLVYRKVMALS